jgi:hypothetical protein
VFLVAISIGVYRLIKDLLSLGETRAHDYGLCKVRVLM